MSQEVADLYRILQQRTPIITGRLRRSIRLIPTMFGYTVVWNTFYASYPHKWSRRSKGYAFRALADAQFYLDRIFLSGTPAERQKGSLGTGGKLYFAKLTEEQEQLISGNNISRADIINVNLARMFGGEFGGN